MSPSRGRLTVLSFAHWRRALMDIGALHGLPAPKAGHPDARAAVLEDLWRELDAIEADEGPAAAPMGKG